MTNKRLISGKRWRKNSFPPFSISGCSHAAAALLISLWLFTGCRSDNRRSGNAQDTVTYGKDIFPEKVQIQHAKGFNITYFDHFKVVSVLSFNGNITDTTRYVLLQRGTPRPTGYEKSRVIEIPLRSLVAMSSMHIGLVEFLEAEQIVTGLGNLKYVYAPKIIQRIDSGKIAEVGKDQGINEEKLITMHPDLVMAVGGPASGMDRYRTLEQAEIPVLINSEWVETTPLGRAEWVKLLAALLNKEKLVNEKFAKMEQEYNRLTALAGKAANKPSIISGLNTKDAWFLPNGNNYMTQFFLDAGGTYHWSKVKSSGSLPLQFEAVYPVALLADFWLNVGFSKNDSKSDILAQDARYSDFKAFKSGKMYSYNERVNARESNDFFESGTVNPHVVLSDLISILHPELLPAHELVYYKQIK